MAKRISVLMAMAICFLVFPLVYGAEQQRLKINCSVHSPYEAFFFRLVEEICSRNQISVVHGTPPVGRSLIHVNEGIDDGDGPRINGLSDTYPNLVRVAEPFGDFMFGAFVKAENIRIDGWPSLSVLNVAYVHGWKIFDTQVTAAKSITKVKNNELLFELLDAGRVDVVLTTKLAGYAMIRNLDLKEIRFVEPPLSVEPNYLYLHKRHSDLALKLSQTLKEIKLDGTYDRLYHQMISPYLPK